MDITYNEMRSRLHGKRVQFCVSVDSELFDKIEKSRGYIPRANFVGEILKKKFSGEKELEFLWTGLPTSSESYTVSIILALHSCL